MIKMFYCCVFIFSCLVLVDAERSFKGKHLPSYVIPCSKSSPEINTCATEHGKQAIPHILKGDKKFKLPLLVPLHLDRIDVKPGNNLELILTNVSLYGLENMVLKEMSIEEKKRHVEVSMIGNGIRIESDYTIRGQILVLPISGEGKADIKLDDIIFKYTMNYDIAQKSDGKDYAAVKKSDVSVKINKAKFHLDNLFNGNKELGDNTNKILNENYEDVLKDLGGTISQIINTIASNIVNSFLGTIPYEEIFLP